MFNLPSATTTIYLISMFQSYVGQMIPVFGIAQKPFVHFQCQLSLVDSVKGLCPVPDCEQGPPPKAPHRYLFRSFRSDKSSRRDIAAYLLHSNASILDALSQRVEILEEGEESRSFDSPSCERRTNAAPTEIRRATAPEGIVCVSKLSFGAMAIVTIAVRLE
uniref:ZP domain-containing protein n=1 Tax=Steinernema glaseri TaxID=37863 RepID=A0A1I7XXD5_9BILA